MISKTQSNFSVNPFNIFAFMLALVALESMHAWFLVGSSTLLYALTFSCFLLLCIMKQKRITLKLSLVLALLFYGLYTYKTIDMSNLTNIVGSVVRFLIVGYVTFLNNENKVVLFRILLKIYTFLVFLGIPFWFLDTIFNVLPSLTYIAKDIGVSFNNYLFFLSPANSEGLYRYMSIFLEPGHLGMISSMLLYVTQFEFKKKEVKALIISVIISFSAAAYALSFLGYLFFTVAQGNLKTLRNLFGRIFFFAISTMVLVVAVNFYQEGIIFQKLFEVFVFSENFMDSRLTSDFKRYYDRSSYEELLYGIGNAEYMEILPKGGSAGWKVFVIKYGFIGTFLLSGFYLALTLHYNNKHVLFLLLIFIASFTQRAYAMWEIQIFIFTCGSAYLVLNETDRLTPKMPTSN